MNALVIGLGHMGGFHRKVLRDLGYDVTTVDVRPGVADYCRPLRRSYDVTAVAVPIEHLAECAAERVHYSHHLLIEKPFAATSTEARELATCFTGQPVAVGYVERFNPQVRVLAETCAGAAIFRRWNTRPSSDIDLDLRSHDIDLARWLGITPQFDTRAGAPRLCREVLHQDGVVDLCAHDTSPLHAQWHAFLSGGPGPASVADAIAVLETIEQPSGGPEEEEDPETTTGGWVAAV